MIAAGLFNEAERAAEELRRALAEAGVQEAVVRVHPQVWDLPEHGPSRLVEIGCVPPSVAVLLADLVRNGAAAPMAPRTPGLAELLGLSRELTAQIDRHLRRLGAR